jgi:hypothetical protein
VRKIADREIVDVPIRDGANVLSLVSHLEAYGAIIEITQDLGKLR